MTGLYCGGYNMSLDPRNLPIENKIAMRVGWLDSRNPMTLFGVDPYHSMWHWCEDVCDGEFDCTLPAKDQTIIWLFAQASDATMFRLRWR